MLSIEDISIPPEPDEEKASLRGSGGRLRVQTPPPMDVQRSFIEYGLREALASIVAPDTHDMVLAVALEHGCLKLLPATAIDFRIFVEQDLRATLSKFFGRAAASAGINHVHDCLPHMFDKQAPDTETEEFEEIQATEPREESNSPETIPAGILPSHVGPEELVLENPYMRATVPAPNMSSCSIFVASDDPEFWQRVSAALETDDANHLSVVVPVTRLATVTRALKVPNLPVMLLLDARGDLNGDEFAELRKVPNPFLSVLAWGSGEDLAASFGDLGNLPVGWNTANLDANEDDLTDLLKTMLRSSNA